MISLRNLKVYAGAAVYDLPRYVRNIHGPGRWVYLRNRDERLTTDTRGARCEWQFTSDLHVAKVFPRASTSIMKTAIREWPIQLRDAPPDATAHPDVSFI